MTQEEIFERVADVIDRKASEYGHLTVENSYDSLAELGFDSLDILDIGLDIQREFNIEDDLDITKHSTPGQITTEIWEKLNEERMTL